MNRNEVVTQTQVLRAMTMGQRLQVAMDLYASAREWKAAALRSLRPDWTEAEVQNEVRRIFLHGRT